MCNAFGKQRKKITFIWVLSSRAFKDHFLGYIMVSDCPV